MTGAENGRIRGLLRGAGGGSSQRRSALAESVARTHTPAVIGGFGGFAGMLALDGVPGGAETVLVSSCDGVGTKALLSAATGSYHSIGQDLVAVNLDDIVTVGARPLFMLDFLLIDDLDVEHVHSIIEGVATTCGAVECILLGGEVAEHRGTRPDNGFDLAGFVVGVVARDRMITGDAIRPGDSLIGLYAEGMRSDGYSLVRRIFADRSLTTAAYPGADHSLGDELCRPARVYTPSILNLIASVDVHGMAHVTGGGVAANIARILPADCAADLHPGGWPIPPIFEEMHRFGEVPWPVLARALPLGIGMVVVVDQEDEQRTMDCLRRTGEQPHMIGTVAAAAPDTSQTVR